MKILVIEDHPKLRENIVKYFKINWYLAEESFNWKEALLKAKLNSYDCVILDINLPIMNWKEFILEFRKSNKNTPVIALTSNSMLEDKVEMFELGVDDYLTKPFELKELEIRIKALTKRKEEKIEEKVIIWNIEINFSKHKVILQWVELELSNKEYLIIEFLAKNKGFPKTKVQILENVWWEAEENLELSSTTLEAHISWIRKKLGKNFIKTIKWTGYIIK